ncbi:WecB/TagA/CpsF family glycosyltransferase [Alienimonas sp. DA493]|uniref:WecB/TagA/CpsF family glycosyltransferase n=1 Tax=Alienimonas sp. DA493 TaxID=3373605 RepID=UPI00375404E7
MDEWHLARRPAGACRVVVTPNVDHVVRLHQEDRAELWEAYRSADLTLADGMPIVAAANLLRRPLPERVPGSDLAPALFAAATADRPLRVFLLGAAPGVADTAAARIAKRFRHASVVGTCCPPLGFQDDPGECEKIERAVAAAQPDVLIVGLGFPKQELWVHRHRERLECAAALCVGATIDFLAGNRARAPRLVGALGLEWAFRMASEPRRLAGRYLNDLASFPGLLLAELRGDLAVAPPRAVWTMPVRPDERPNAPAAAATQPVLEAQVETEAEMPSELGLTDSFPPTNEAEPTTPQR